MSEDTDGEGPDQDTTPRLPKEVNLELRKKYKRMNDYSNGTGKKRDGAEKLAYEIQHLQQELKGSMAFHIGEVPAPGKLLIVKKFP